MAKRKIKQCDTIEIQRSQINFNPFNPKNHADKKILEQKKNFLKVGLHGGITWNKRSGNLIDGHRRIKAMDLHYGYDGTPKSDYSVMVTVVDMDSKTEKEQMTYMALGNTKADYSLIAEYLPDIDSVAAGIDEYDLSQIQSFLPEEHAIDIESFDNLITPLPIEDRDNESLQENESKVDDNTTKARIKESKQKQKERGRERYADLNAYITISFANSEEKRMFCEIMNIPQTDMFIEGDAVLNAIN